MSQKRSLMLKLCDDDDRNKKITEKIERVATRVRYTTPFSWERKMPHASFHVCVCGERQLDTARFHTHTHTCATAKAWHILRELVSDNEEYGPVQVAPCECVDLTLDRLDEMNAADTLVFIAQAGSPE